MAKQEFPKCVFFADGTKQIFYTAEDLCKCKSEWFETPDCKPKDKPKPKRKIKVKEPESIV